MNETQTITLDDLPMRVATVVSKVIEGDKTAQAEVILVLPEKGQVKVLNELGARIWELIDGENRVRDLVARITGEYAVDEQEARRDILAFLSELRTKGIITIYSQGDAG
ncbi:MAG: PqqD family protein [Anaerolineales bacterium]|nr:PqqD family protein [Anaerolineales bacterium]